MNYGKSPINPLVFSGTGAESKRIPALAERLRRLWPEATGDTFPMTDGALEIALGYAWSRSGVAEAGGGGWWTGSMAGSGNLGAVPDDDGKLRFYKSGVIGEVERTAADAAAYDFLRAITQWPAIDELKAGNVLGYAAKQGDFGNTIEERILGGRVIASHLPAVAAALGHTKIHARIAPELLANEPRSSQSKTIPRTAMVENATPIEGAGVTIAVSVAAAVLAAGTAAVVSHALDKKVPGKPVYLQFPAEMVAAAQRKKRAAAKKKARGATPELAQNREPTGLPYTPSELTQRLAQEHAFREANKGRLPAVADLPGTSRDAKGDLYYAKPASAALDDDRGSIAALRAIPGVTVSVPALDEDRGSLASTSANAKLTPEDMKQMFPDYTPAQIDEALKSLNGVDVEIPSDSADMLDALAIEMSDKYPTRYEGPRLGSVGGAIAAASGWRLFLYALFGTWVIGTIGLAVSEVIHGPEKPEKRELPGPTVYEKSLQAMQNAADKASGQATTKISGIDDADYFKIIGTLAAASGRPFPHSKDAIKEAFSEAAYVGGEADVDTETAAASDAYATELSGAPGFRWQYYACINGKAVQIGPLFPNIGIGVVDSAMKLAYSWKTDSSPCHDLVSATIWRLGIDDSGPGGAPVAISGTSDSQLEGTGTVVAVVAGGLAAGALVAAGLSKVTSAKGAELTPEASPVAVAPTVPTPAGPTAKPIPRTALAELQKKSWPTPWGTYVPGGKLPPGTSFEKPPEGIDGKIYTPIPIPVSPSSPTGVIWGPMLGKDGKPLTVDGVESTVMSGVNETLQALHLAGALPRARVVPGGGIVWYIETPRERTKPFPFGIVSIGAKNDEPDDIDNALATGSDVADVATGIMQAVAAGKKIAQRQAVTEDPRCRKVVRAFVEKHPIVTRIWGSDLKALAGTTPEAAPFVDRYTDELLRQRSERGWQNFGNYIPTVEEDRSVLVSLGLSQQEEDAVYTAASRSAATALDLYAPGAGQGAMQASDAISSLITGRQLAPHTKPSSSHAVKKPKADQVKKLRTQLSEERAKVEIAKEWARGHGILAAVTSPDLRQIQGTSDEPRTVVPTAWPTHSKNQELIPQ